MEGTSAGWPLSPPAHARRSWLAFASPARFDPLAGRLVPWFFALAVAFALAGLAVGFLVAPADAQQGEAYRIIFIHVPAAWMSMFIYLVMACYGALALVYRTRLSALMARALAPTGAAFTVIALVSGSLWGQPTWGTWWVWDARLTSELLLLFLYLGFLALDGAIGNHRRAERACSLLALAGVLNLPVIWYSVRWWNTLHQGASVSFTSAPTMAFTMFLGMVLMALGCWMHAIAVALVRVRCLLREREVLPAAA